MTGTVSGNETVKTGLFITLEGGEGAGKSTQILRLKNYLENRGHDVVLTREPGGTPDAETLRKVILDQQYDWDPMEQLLLFNAARHHHWRQLINPALDRGCTVVCDRYLDSTIAYQGAAGGISPQTVIGLHDMVFGQTAYPDLTLYLDIPVDQALNRRSRRDAGQEKDRFESAELIFHEKLRRGFLQLCDRYPERIKCIDARPEEDTVARQIAETVETHLNHG